MPIGFAPNFLEDLFYGLMNPAPRPVERPQDWRDEWGELAMPRGGEEEIYRRETPMSDPEKGIGVLTERTREILPTGTEGRAAINERLASEEEQIAREAAREAEKQRLLEAAGRKASQQEFMSGTVPLVEDYDKGIAIGGDPSRGSRDEILARIRAQALAKGGGSVGAKGGSFSQAPDSPEIQQRLAARDAWASEQPTRDLEFALTPEQQQMRPDAAANARELLPQLQQQSALRRQQALQEKLVSKLADGSGKIPFEQAMQLEAAGVSIPVGARGMAPEQFDAKITEIISGSTRDLEQAIAAQNMGAPPEAVNMITSFSSTVRDKALRLKEMVDSGQMKRDEAAKILEEIIQKEAIATNAIQAFQVINPQPMAPAVQAGE